MSKAIRAFKRLFATKLDNFEAILDTICNVDENGELVFDDHAGWVTFEDWGSEAVDESANPVMVLMAEEELKDDIATVMALESVDHSVKMFLSNVYKDKVLHMDGDITSCPLSARPVGWVKPADWWC